MIEELSICIKYMKVVAEMMEAGHGSVLMLDEERTALHEELLETLKLDALTVSGICSRLDIWLNLPDVGAVTRPANVAKYGTRLHELLTSDFVKNARWSEVEKTYKRLRGMWYDDDKYDGWHAGLMSK